MYGEEALGCWMMMMGSESELDTVACCISMSRPVVVVVVRTVCRLLTVRLYGHT